MAIPPDAPVGSTVTVKCQNCKYAYNAEVPEQKVTQKSPASAASRGFGLAILSFGLVMGAVTGMQFYWMGNLNLMTLFWAVVGVIAGIARLNR
jgi:hypothetical protein